MIANVQALTSEDLVYQAMQNPGIQQQVIDWNRFQLEEKGIEADGTPTGQYSNRTIQYKIERGQRYDHVTLLDTGEFYNSMRVRNSPNGFTVTGDMRKPNRDLEVSFPKALGLTNDSIIEIIQFVRKEIVQEVLTAIRA